MKRKIYKLLSSTKQGLFALALTVFSGTAYSQATYTLNYTGAVQTLNLQAGTFSIECWGGNGYTQTAGFNGKGGYASGILTLGSAQTIYIYVGGFGGYQSAGVFANAWTFNGGGTGYPGLTNAGYGNGGGASDIRTVGGAWDNATSLASRAIVAGGGGATSHSSYLGGHGGGLTGGTGTYFSPDQAGGPTGGSQTAGGSNTGYTSGITPATIGKASTWNGSALTDSYLAGGGGGYYGGASGRVAGGGGSSYTGGVTSGTTIMSGQPGFPTNPDVTGNGIVIIKELCNITLSVTGLNVSGATCAGNSVTLTTNAISNYVWSNGATTSSIIVSPSSTTLYSLTATSPSNCTASAAITVSVNSGVPVLTVVNTANAGGICPTKSVNLTASGALTYTWTGGSPTVTNGVTFNPTAAHDYTVTGANGCGTSSAVTSVSVHPPPTVNPSASSSTLCAGSGLTLTATGNATNYVWSGGSAPSGNGVGFTPPASTITYTATGTSALSCTAQATIPVTVHATPNAAPAANPALVCIGNSSTLTASGALSYTWASLTNTVFTNTFVITPSAPGVTTYTVTKANSTCVDTKTISVTTNSLPGIFAMVTPTVVCALKPASLTIGGGTSYTWTAPGTPNFSFTGASPVVYPQAPAEYTVAASDGTCISVTTVSLAVDPNPTITIAASAPSICAGSAVTMTAQGGSSYTWTSSSSSSTLYTQTISESPIIATSYNVTGDNSFGCTATANQVIIVHNTPPLTVTSSKNLVCSGGPSTLTAGGANTYTWDASAGGVLTSTTLVNPVALSSGPVEYSVSGSYTSTGCKSTKTVQVNVFVPVLTVSGNTATCSGGQISLSALGGNANTYTWNTGTSTSNFQNVTTTLTAPAIFTVSATGTSVSINSAICPAAQTVAVGIHSNPTITAVQGRTTMICTGESVELHAEGGLSYTWNNSQTGPTITVIPPFQTNNYVVTGTDVNGCTASATVQVKISACTGVNELSGKDDNLVVYPNPNNGEFIIKADSEMSLALVNELGQTVRTVILSHITGYTVSVTDLAKGIYFITGGNENVRMNQKIIVTK